jgi:hypothetical protein
MAAWARQGCSAKEYHQFMPRLVDWFIEYMISVEMGAIDCAA